MPFTRTDEEVAVLLAKYQAQHLKRLSLEEMKVDTLFYFAKKNEDGDRIGPPLRLHGLPKAAVIRVQSEQRRAMGLGDVLITIDQDQWEELSDQSKEALIDHELEHIEPVRKMNVPVMDDQGRPRLRLKQHDWDISGFRCIAERHGQHALETVAAVNFAVEYGQLLFPFALATKEAKPQNLGGRLRGNGGQPGIN